MDYERACKLLKIHLKHTEKQLKKGYHLAALEHHPDKNKDVKNAHVKFQEILDAYGFLQHHNKTFQHVYFDCNISYVDLLKRVLGEFDDSFADTMFIETTFKTLISKVSLKVFEKLDKKKSQKLFDFIYQYNSLFKFDVEIIKQIQTIVRNKMKDDNVIILNPNINDLIEGSIYKLDIFNKEFYIPLWHQELYYDVNNSDLIVKIIPELNVSDEKITALHIDNNNNIFISINYSISTILNENKLDFCLGEHTFSIPGEELNIIKKQTKVLYNKGFYKMNNQNIFEPKGKSNIYVEIQLY